MNCKTLGMLWWSSLSVALTGFAWDGAYVGMNVEILARHETVAEFLGRRPHRCRGLTSLCPDDCGESGTVAEFRIKRYLDYERLGEYGDPRTDQLVFMLEDNRGNPKAPAAVRAVVQELEEGDRVLLSWNHIYVTVDGYAGPERPVTRLEPIPAIGTAPWYQALDRVAAVRDAEDRGPALRSPEWFEAVSLALGVYDEAGHGPDPDGDEWRRAAHWKAFGIR
jgi:hypothetical protein